MKEAVEAGCRLLDEQRPGWWRRIDVERLEMASAKECILGQEFKTFGHGKYVLGISIGRDYGFALNSGDLRLNHHLAWKELRGLWLEAIECRLLRDELEASADIGVKAEEELVVA